MITNLFYIAIGILLIVFIFINVQKHMMSEGESILWMVGAFFILILAIFPDIIIFLANLVGITYAPSLLFFLTSIFLLIFSFRNSQQLSILAEKNKELIQFSALLEKRVRVLEDFRTENK
ncbi:DUF2304 domain-containing protein [Acetobacterium tundrae]|uniref:DUF2304 family protein n=1 Tax=Acetobacterium tundrae TaxID=132932 RepID=A0ABR6WJR6_9FIRM|nr:DUF2304 domain-containing protein [Acetobacterium tundrae]MBC3796740.1 DUF2304 family protein [Acetobacterium tundrae]